MDITQTIVAQATDPKVAFMAAAVFGYCLYKFMASRKSPRAIAEDSDETDDDDIVNKMI